MSDLSRRRQVVIGVLCGVAALVCFAGALQLYGNPMQRDVALATLITGLLAASMAGSVLFQLRR